HPATGIEEALLLERHLHATLVAVLLTESRLAERSRELRHPRALTDLVERPAGVVQLTQLDGGLGVVQQDLRVTEEHPGDLLPAVLVVDARTHALWAQASRVTAVPVLDRAASRVETCDHVPVGEGKTAEGLDNTVRIQVLDVVRSLLPLRTV